MFNFSLVDHSITYYRSLSRTKDLNVKAGEKLNKGLSKIKHGVLGKSMEGIIDAPADPAFDMIDICANNEDDEDEIIDETLTAKGFNPLFEYRDLSAWRVNISKVATHRDVNGKNSFFFVIEVQRCGSSDPTTNPESTTSEFFPRNGVGFFNKLIFFIWTLFDSQTKLRFEQVK